MTGQRVERLQVLVGIEYDGLSGHTNIYWFRAIRPGLIARRSSGCLDHPRRYCISRLHQFCEPRPDLLMIYSWLLLCRSFGEAGVGIDIPAGVIRAENLALPRLHTIGQA